MPTASPIVLGIDPGSYITGFGVITQVGNRLVHLQSGSIQTPKGWPLERRLLKIRDELFKVAQSTSPTVMAVESIFYAKNVRSALSLAHARGVALLVAAEVGIPVAEYSPIEVKKATVGYGRADKEQIALMVARLFQLPQGLSEELHDTSDALAVALCHLNARATARKIAGSGSISPAAIDKLGSQMHRRRT